MAVGRIAWIVSSRIILFLVGFTHILLPIIMLATMDNDFLIFGVVIFNMLLMGFVLYLTREPKDNFLIAGFLCSVLVIIFWVLFNGLYSLPPGKPYFVLLSPAYILMFNIIDKLDKRNSQNPAPPASSDEGETMPAIRFVPLTEPTPAIAAAFSRWENDPLLIPLSRPNRDQQELEKRHTVTADDLAGRLANQRIFLIYEGERLLGEMGFQVDPRHLLKKEPGTAWIGITIGEAHGRGRGIGFQALQYLERQIAAQGLRRIELGVFEFNLAAQSLYVKLGYQEIGRIEDFTYWDGLMWQDVRMEKYLAVGAS